MAEKGRHYTAVALAACAGLWGFPAAAEEVLLETTPLVQGSLATVTPFDVTSPGTVTVILADLAWPEKLASLTFAATTPNAVLATLGGPGEVSFKVSKPGIYDAVVGAIASPGFLDLGWYSMTVEFAPAAVPLPAGAWLLLSGLGALVCTLRRRGALPARAAG